MVSAWMTCISAAASAMATAAVVTWYCDNCSLAGFLTGSSQAYQLIDQHARLPCSPCILRNDVASLLCVHMQTLLVAGWQCLFSVKEYCGLHDTVGCLRNWPLIPVEANVHKYYNVELGWYLQLMLKHVMGE
jgi:hypothetical protein